ncbi:YhcU family protein [Peribacillus frigoritolerans]|uniref:YhcU family protein n=1 Tax=Peribacillus frigoritolerans TaxID=450367 RepID=UPI002226F371|nr:YhcU family protein [Peribacillus frigoritolerans]UYY99887.1 YhcU family protein [Peribacillus frigoritolerans]
MKTVFSSTEEQEQEIASLVSRFYESVFPKYFTESEILHFREIGVLEPNQSSVTYLATLRDAFQVMTCLQVLMSILDKQKRVMEPKSEELFQHNITLLNECGIFFPFYYDHFSSINLDANNDMQMMDIQVANQYLV